MSHSDHPERPARFRADTDVSSLSPKDAERAARQERNRAERAARQAANKAARAERKSQRTKDRVGKATASAEPAEQEEDRTRPFRPTQAFDILVIAQAGRLERQAALLAASLRHSGPEFPGRMIVAEPQPTGVWEGRDVRISADARAALTAFGAEIVPLHARVFGQSYPYGNKIEALSLLPAGEPFLFLDSDTLVTGRLDAVPFDFARPTASMRREGTWPKPPLYGPGYEDIWRSLYDRFGLEFESSRDLSQPDEHWERYLYFNAGWFCGADPAEFGGRFLTWAREARDDPGEALAAQELEPWLDQIVLPLVIHSLGGGRPGPELDGMDGDVTCHYRKLSLLYATGPDGAVRVIEALADLPELAPVMAGWPAWQQLVRGGDGTRLIRPMFDRDRLPATEQPIRQALKAESLWLD